MGDFDIDFSELEKFHDVLEQIARDFPKETKQMMQKVGNESRKIVYRKAKQLVDKKSGKYYKSIRRGKVWSEDGALMVRVYSNAPHKFLIENGHRIVDKNGNEKGFVRGKKVFQKSERDIADQFEEIVIDQLNKTFDKL